MPPPDDGIGSEPSTVSANQIARTAERLAALEATIRAEIPSVKADTERLRSMTHDLSGTLQSFVAMTLTGQTTLKMHMEACDRRGAKIEKLGFVIIGLVITTLGFLIQREFFHP